MANDGQDILVQRMMKLSRQGWKYAKDRLTHPKLPNMMYNVCIAVYLNPGISQDGVAHYLKTDKSSVAKVVSRSLQDGYLERKVNPEDHREYRLYLTDKGNETIGEVLNDLKEWQNEVLQVLNERDRHKFRELFEKVASSAEKIDQE